MSSAYQPLHHKYRPQRFDQLVGQEAIAATLGHALTSNRIAPVSYTHLTLPTNREV